MGIHLDHGSEFDDVVEAIDAGINSVMLDVSDLPFEENVKLTREVVEYAHPKGVDVEGELGYMASGEPGVEPPASADEAGFTDPEQAEEFVERTGIDYLTVSIGTVHGVYAGTPKLDYERLSEIRKRVKVPLILHGGSGTPCEMVQKAISLGVSRINIYTEYAVATDRALRRFLAENPNSLAIPHAVERAMDAVEEGVRARINCFTVAMREKLK